MAQPNIAIIIYSMYGHIAKMAEAVKQGIEEAGGSATIYQITETLTPEVLAMLKAPPKPDYPVLSPFDIGKFDAYMFGFPTRFGNMPAQWRAFWDATGIVWVKGELHGKPCGIFVSTGTSPGGQESTALSVLPTLVHHGLVFVPLGYAKCRDELSTLEEVRGGSAFGSGTLAGNGGVRSPSELELKVARIQGSEFYKVAVKMAAK